MTNTPTPRRIEWAGPDGSSVFTDEDGVHIRTGDGRAMEMPDVERLFSLWTHVRAMVDADHIPAPKLPTREEIRAGGYQRIEEQAARRAVRAVELAFHPDATGPAF